MHDISYTFSQSFPWRNQTLFHAIAVGALVITTCNYGNPGRWQEATEKATMHGGHPKPTPTKATAFPPSKKEVILLKRRICITDAGV
jgi:hypothetical protein